MPLEIYFPTFIDGVHGYAWVWGVGVEFTTNGGITWNIATSGVTIGLYGIIDIVIDESGVYVTDGTFTVFVLRGWRWLFAQDHGVVMAQVQLSYAFQDELGTSATTVIYATADGAKTVTELLADWEAEAVLLDHITDAQITHGKVTIITAPAGAEKSAPAEGSRVEICGTFNYGNASNPRKWGGLVPAFADTKIQLDGKIDLADTDVKNYVESLDGTSPPASVVPTNSAFVALNSFLDSRLSSRKRRRQLARSSGELGPLPA